MNRYLSGTPQRTFYSFFSGAIAVLAFSPYEIFPMAILSIALIIYLWLQSSPRSALFFGYIYGLGFFGFGVSWLHISINLFGGVNIVVAVFITFLLIAFLSLFPALTGYLTRKLHSKHDHGLSILLGIPILWTLGEWIRSWIFTGFPWLNLGYSQAGSVLNGFAPISGVFGISLVVVFTSVAIVSVFSADKKRQLILCSLIVLVWSFAWLAGTVKWTTRTEQELSVALIQGAVPQEIKWRADMRQPTMDLYRNLVQPHIQRDLIILPEAAIPVYFHQATDYINGYLNETRKNKNHILTGMPIYDRDTDKYYNGVVFLGDDINFYLKKHLVPFGEYLPLKFLLKNIIDSLNIPMSDFSSGPEVAPLLDAGKYKIGISICYEDTFGEEVIQGLPDAGILVNISNDAWFGDSVAPHQHLQMARMRALETGRYLLRATNTGITAIIDENGRIVSHLPQFIPASLTGDVAVFSGHTPYTRFGNYPVVIFCFCVLVFLAYSIKNTRV